MPCLSRVVDDIGGCGRTHVFLLRIRHGDHDRLMLMRKVHVNGLALKGKALNGKKTGETTKQKHYVRAIHQRFPREAEAPQGVLDCVVRRASCCPSPPTTCGCIEDAPATTHAW